MFHFFLFVFLYMLYGIFLSAIMYKYNIWNIRPDFKDDLNFQLFLIIAVSPIFTAGILFIECPIRLFKYIIDNDPAIIDKIDDIDNNNTSDDNFSNISNNDTL